MFLRPEECAFPLLHDGVVAFRDGGRLVRPDGGALLHDGALEDAREKSCLNSW